MINMIIKLDEFCKQLPFLLALHVIGIAGKVAFLKIVRHCNFVGLKYYAILYFQIILLNPGSLEINLNITGLGVILILNLLSSHR